MAASSHRDTTFFMQLSLFIPRHVVQTSVAQLKGGGNGGGGGSGGGGGGVHTVRTTALVATSSRRRAGACNLPESPDIRFSTFLLAANPLVALLHFVFPPRFSTFIKNVVEYFSAAAVAFKN